jgi:hypothetical protein
MCYEKSRTSRKIRKNIQLRRNTTLLKTNNFQSVGALY